MWGELGVNGPFENVIHTFFLAILLACWELQNVFTHLNMKCLTVTIASCTTYFSSTMPSTLLVEAVSLMILFESYQKFIHILENWQVKSSWPLCKEKKKTVVSVPVTDIGEIFRASNSSVLHFSTKPSHFTSYPNSSILCTLPNVFLDFFHFTTLLISNVQYFYLFFSLLYINACVTLKI